MDPGDVYRLKAAEIGAKARQETNLILRAELKKLALAYLLLAEQAESNARTDVVYETPPERPAASSNTLSNKSSNRRA